MKETHWYRCGFGHVWETEPAGIFGECPECKVEVVERFDTGNRMPNLKGSEEYIGLYG